MAQMKATMVIYWVVLFMFSACTQAERAENDSRTDSGFENLDIDMHTSRISLDYHGTYTGILPCADCEGIQTKISLFEDGTYQLRQLYPGIGKDRIFESDGKFDWIDSGSTIILLSEEPPNIYRVGENHLRKLDIEARLITGELADYYILHKEN